MANRITATPETLLTQASMTANGYFKSAIQDIDREFGEGYAKNHPELIAAFMRTMAADFHTAITAQAIQDTAEEIASALTRNLHDKS